ncbi:MAG TPA: AMP-binding protein [Stellaceae bacterium]|nr:AMP-binding protein [Stellaceae bacterium]
MRAEATSSPTKTEVWPLLRQPRLDAPVAFRRGHAIPAPEFLRDVAALAAALPRRPHVVNLCTDRYRFTVGLAAALCREQVSLLPPDDRPATIRAIASDFADVYCLTDGAAPAVVPSFAFPPLAGAFAAAAPLPAFPAAQPAVVLFTSGSTGRPKPTEKPWGVLVESARAAGVRLGVDALPGAAIVGTVPHQHSYGFESTVLLALQHGLAFEAERPFYPADVAASLATLPRPRLLVTTPIHLRALVDESESLPPVDLIVSATAPLAMDLAASAEARFGAPLVEIYGCSEAGQVATRRTAREELWQCLDGIVLRREGATTFASGAAVARETLLHDAIELSGDGRFRLLGRAADMVNIAGKRSSLAHLEHHLKAIDGVVDGAFLVPDGERRRVPRLVAFAVAPGRSAEAILAALRERIDAAFLPRPLLIVEALPRNHLGKLPREALLRLAAERGAL